ncbi:MAG: ABC transporter permease [Candidatus Sumerlaeia bacterium]|nr:ABC transporter permease [Candidatus Sumerlaeia bacterium]
MLLFWNKIHRFAGGIFEIVGGSTILLLNAFCQIRFNARDLGRLVQQFQLIGINSFPLAVMIGFFTGMIFALNFGIPLRDYGAEETIGGILTVAMVRTLGPVFTAFILAARVGSAMTAELGTMSVSEEIDSLRMMNIKPERFLALPRILGSIIINPLLTIYSTSAGVVGGWLVARSYLNVSDDTYWLDIYRLMNSKEVYTGLTKSVVFALVYSSICVYIGMTTKGGAEGVGRSTTTAVVSSLTMILVADFVITRFIFG